MWGRSLANSRRNSLRNVAVTAPYLREGEFTAPGTWAQLERVFDQRVFRFSFWFN